MSLPSPRPARHAVPALPLRICRSQVVRGLVAVLPDSASPWTVAHQAPPWDCPVKNTGVACHFLPQGIFPVQASNPRLLRLPVLAGEFFITSTTWKVHVP